MRHPAAARRTRRRFVGTSAPAGVPGRGHRPVGPDGRRDPGIRSRLCEHPRRAEPAGRVADGVIDSAVPVVSLPHPPHDHVAPAGRENLEGPRCSGVDGVGRRERLRTAEADRAGRHGNLEKVRAARLLRLPGNGRAAVPSRGDRRTGAGLGDEVRRPETSRRRPAARHYAESSGPADLLFPGGDDVARGGDGDRRVGDRGSREGPQHERGAEPGAGRWGSQGEAGEDDAQGRDAGEPGAMTPPPASHRLRRPVHAGVAYTGPFTGCG